MAVTINTASQRYASHYTSLLHLVNDHQLNDLTLDAVGAFTADVMLKESEGFAANFTFGHQLAYRTRVGL
jgi:hypothetical protein